MKKIFAIAVAVLMLGLSACGGAGASSEKPASTAPSAQASVASSTGESADATVGDGKYHIAYSMNAMDEFQSEWWGYFIDYMEGELGHKVTMINAEGKMDKQLADVESLIQLKPDLIAIKSNDQDGVVACFEACDAAGIPSVDSDMGANTDIPLHLMSDQRNHGIVTGEFANQWLTDNPDTNIVAGYLIGIDVPSVIGRRDGWTETMDEAGNSERYEVVAEKVCNWSATEAMAVVEDWMQAYPDLNWIAAMSDEMAIAAVNVVEASGKSGEIVVVGVDGSPNAQELIREGKLTGTAFIPRKLMAIVTADYLVQICEQGELGDLAGTTIDISEGQNRFLTKDNIEEILGQTS